jgi:hypothetical protein
MQSPTMGSFAETSMSENLNLKRMHSNSLTKANRTYFRSINFQAQAASGVGNERIGGSSETNIHNS